MTLHISPRTRILGRSMQFLAGGFGLGLLGGLFITEAATALAAPIALVTVALFAVVSAIQLLLMLSGA